MNRRSSLATLAVLSVAGSSSLATPVSFWDATIDRSDEAALTKLPFLGDIRRATDLLDPLMSKINEAAENRFEMIFDTFGPCWKLAISLDQKKLHVSWARANLVALGKDDRPARRDFYLRGTVLTALFQKEILDTVNKIFAWNPASFNKKAETGQDVPVFYIRWYLKGAGKGLLLRAADLTKQVSNLTELLKAKKQLLDAIGTGA